jgi:hypothetical protein
LELPENVHSFPRNRVSSVVKQHFQTSETASESLLVEGWSLSKNRAPRATWPSSVQTEIRVSEIWDSVEQFQAFGAKLMPLLASAGIEFSGEPQIFGVHNIQKR